MTKKLSWSAAGEEAVKNFKKGEEVEAVVLNGPALVALMTFGMWLVTAVIIGSVNAVEGGPSARAVHLGAHNATHLVDEEPQHRDAADRDMRQVGEEAGRELDVLEAVEEDPAIEAAGTGDEPQNGVEEVDRAEQAEEVLAA